MIEPLPISIGGIVPAGHLYIERPEDREFMEHIERHRWVNLYGSRLMGKSSLASRAVRWHRSKGQKVAYLNIEELVVDEAKPPSEREFFESLAERWQDELGINANFDSVLRDGSAGENFARMIDRILLMIGPEQLLLVIDEIDVLTRLPYGDSVLNMFRILHERRGRDWDRYGRLSLALVGLRPLAEQSAAVSGLAASFCAEMRVREFRETQNVAAALAQGLRPLTDSSAIVNRILWHSGGQPLLTMLMLDTAARRALTTSDAIDKLATDFVQLRESAPEVLFDTAKRLIVEDRKDSIFALNTYLQVVNRPDENVPGTAPGSGLLLASGLVRLEDGNLRVKCRLFERAFDLKWAESALAEAGTERGRFFIRSPRPDADRKKVCIVNTGGTIGMVLRGDKVVAPESAEEFLHYHPELRELADIDFEQVSAFDSINMYPTEWKAISRFIYERRRKGYSGFVITHGTDTMCFTASAVAFALGLNLSFPVVFTGSQTTPDKYHGDARTNLYRAVMTAQEADLHEVAICFGDRVFRAVRAQKRDDQRFEGFESPTYPELAVITEEVNLRYDLLRPAPHAGNSIQLIDRFAEGVLEIALYPGLEPEFFMKLLDLAGGNGVPKLNGIIIQTLGAGNIATRDRYSFLPFIRRAVKDMKIPVLVTSQYPPDPESYRKYSPAQAPVEAGAIHAGTMTSAAAVSKFRWVLAQVEDIPDAEDRIDQVKRMMIEIDYVGELATKSRKVMRTN